METKVFVQEGLMRVLASVSVQVVGTALRHYTENLPPHRK